MEYNSLQIRCQDNVKIDSKDWKEYVKSLINLVRSILPFRFDRDQHTEE